jgi:hypothetical protein
VSASIRYRQFELRGGYSRLVCWLEDAPELIPGCRLTLKGAPAGTIWTIHYRYDGTTTESQYRTWRVGGIHAR